MSETWKASDNIQEWCRSVVEKHHPSLADARIVVAFTDSKPFVRNRFNFGKVTKFSAFNQLFQRTKYDYCLVICADVWQSILKAEQREPLLDLLLTCCSPEYEPETVVENGKKKVVKDEWGRVKYTNEIKYDEDGNPKWLVLPLDIVTFVENISRYGVWCDEHVGNLKDTVAEDETA